MALSADGVGALLAGLEADYARSLKFLADLERSLGGPVSSQPTGSSTPLVVEQPSAPATSAHHHQTGGEGQESPGVAGDAKGRRRGWQADKGWLQAAGKAKADGTVAEQEDDAALQLASRSPSVVQLSWPGGDGLSGDALAPRAADPSGASPPMAFRATRRGSGLSLSSLAPTAPPAGPLAADQTTATQRRTLPSRRATFTAGPGRPQHQHAQAACRSSNSSGRLLPARRATFNLGQQQQQAQRDEPSSRRLPAIGGTAPSSPSAAACMHMPWARTTPEEDRPVSGSPLAGSSFRSSRRGSVTGALGLHSGEAGDALGARAPAQQIMAFMASAMLQAGGGGSKWDEATVAVHSSTPPTQTGRRASLSEVADDGFSGAGSTGSSGKPSQGAAASSQQLLPHRAMYGQAPSSRASYDVLPHIAEAEVCRDGDTNGSLQGEAVAASRSTTTGS